MELESRHQSRQRRIADGLTRMDARRARAADERAMNKRVRTILGTGVGLMALTIGVLWLAALLFPCQP